VLARGARWSAPPLNAWTSETFWQNLWKREYRAQHSDPPRRRKAFLKPSSAARAVASRAPFIERVDLLVKLISHLHGVPNAEIDRRCRGGGSETERADCAARSSVLLA
jgi:hypothetical protein